MKTKQSSSTGSKPKFPFYFNPKSENRKLAQLIEAIVSCELEKSPKTPKPFKVVGFQLKNQEKVSIDRIQAKN